MLQVNKHIESIQFEFQSYQDAYPFTGTVKKVTYDVSGEAIHDAEAVARRLLGRQ